VADQSGEAVREFGDTCEVRAAGAGILEHGAVVLDTITKLEIYRTS